MKRLVFPSVLLAGWVVVLVIFFTPEADNGHGLPHTRIAEMDAGGAGLERHRPVLFTGWLFGSLLIGGFVSLLAWGASAGGHEVRRDLFFLLGFCVFEAVFSAMCVAYFWSVSNPDEVAFWGGFPAATAWLLYGMWLAPGVFIVGYVLLFHRWILPASSVERFDKIMRETRSRST